jgi:hypothetical protein
VPKKPPRKAQTKPDAQPHRFLLPQRELIIEGINPRTEKPFVAEGDGAALPKIVNLFERLSRPPKDRWELRAWRTAIESRTDEIAAECLQEMALADTMTPSQSEPQMRSFEHAATVLAGFDALLPYTQSLLLSAWPRVSIAVEGAKAYQSYRQKFAPRAPVVRKGEKRPNPIERNKSWKRTANHLLAERCQRFANEYWGEENSKLRQGGHLQNLIELVYQYATKLPVPYFKRVIRQLQEQERYIPEEFRRLRSR